MKQELQLTCDLIKHRRTEYKHTRNKHRLQCEFVG